VLLTGRGINVLVGIERSMENASRALGSPATPAADTAPAASSIQQRRTSLSPQETVASAPDRPGASRGN
jgi:hypothetical protein